MTASIPTSWTCGRCGTYTNSAEHGAGLTITGTPITHWVLCSDCANSVRDLLATTPEQVLEREEATRRASFGAGFDAGLAEPRDTDDAYIRSASVRGVCSGGGPSRTPGKVLIEFMVDEGPERHLNSEWTLTPIAEGARL